MSLPIVILAADYYRNNTYYGINFQPPAVNTKRLLSLLNNNWKNEIIISFTDH